MNVNKRPEKDCPTCGNHFVCVRSEQKYCSRKCIPAPGRKHLVCPCGVNTGSYQRKYCCSEHREKWGGKKPPVAMITHTCLGCGDTFERPHYYPGKKKYCSVRCQHKEQKKTTDIAALLNGKGTLIFRSTWEMRFYCACLRFDIPVRSYDGPDIPTDLGNYRPDFIVTLPHGEQIVDVKGWYRPESFAKITQAREWGYDVQLIPKNTLLAMEQGVMWWETSSSIVILRKA